MVGFISWVPTWMRSRLQKSALSQWLRQLVTVQAIALLAWLQLQLVRRSSCIGVLVLGKSHGRRDVFAAARWCYCGPG